MATMTRHLMRPVEESGAEERNTPSRWRPRKRHTSRSVPRLIVTSLVAALLVLPIAEGTQMAEAGNNKKSKLVTRTFSSNGQIEIPDVGTEGSGDPYPATIDVDAFAKYKKAKIKDVNVTLRDFGHTFPDNVDVMLALGNRRATVMSDVGGNNDVNGLNLTLDDQAGAALPDGGALADGTYRPTNEVGFGEADAADDPFIAPAPAPSTNVNLATFKNAKPDGNWRLFVLDDFNNDDGDFSGGWTLEITAKVKKDKKNKK